MVLTTPAGSSRPNTSIVTLEDNLVNVALMDENIWKKGQAF